MQRKRRLEEKFSNFSCRFLSPIIFFNLNLNYSNLLHLRNLQEQVEKAFCFNNCSDLSLFEYVVLVISKVFFSQLGQNNFGNKIPFLKKDFGFVNCTFMYIINVYFLIYPSVGRLEHADCKCIPN